MSRSAAPKAIDWSNHPFLNSRHVLKGQRYYERSRFVPHQGKREIARRKGDLKR